jgi:nitrogen fixation protein FixH
VIRTTYRGIDVRGDCYLVSIFLAINRKINASNNTKSTGLKKRLIVESKAVVVKLHRILTHLA